MLRLDLLVVPGPGLPLRLCERLLRLQRQPVDIHGLTSSAGRRWSRPMAPRAAGGCSTAAPGPLDSGVASARTPLSAVAELDRRPAPHPPSAGAAAPAR